MFPWVTLPGPPVDDFDGDATTERITPVKEEEGPKQVPLDHCPRCGKGYHWYLSWKHPCKMCGYPGLLDDDE